MTGAEALDKSEACLRCAEKVAVSLNVRRCIKRSLHVGQANAAGEWGLAL